MLPFHKRKETKDEELCRNHCRSCALAGTGPAEQKSAIRGFFDRSTLEEVSRETAFRGAIDVARIGESMKTLSARPHHVGSEGDRANAEWILAQFRSFGWDAKIETFDVLFPTPAGRVLDPAGEIHGEAR